MSHTDSRSYPYALVERREDNRPTDHTSTLAELGARLEQHARDYREKNGPGFLPATFGGGRRANEDVESVHWLALDMEKTEGTVDGLQGPLTGCQRIVYSTWSHGDRRNWSPGHPRFRVLLPYTRPVGPAEHRAIFAHIVDILDGAPDSATKDPARLMYTPRQRNPKAERDPWVTVHDDGPGLDPEALPDGDGGTVAVETLVERTNEPPAASKESPACRNATLGCRSHAQMNHAMTRYAEAALTDALETVRTAPMGTRHNALCEQAFSMGTLVGAGVLKPTETTRLLVGAATSNGLPDSEAKRTARDGIDAGRAKPRDLTSIRRRDTSAHSSDTFFPAPRVADKTDPKGDSTSDDIPSLKEINAYLSGDDEQNDERLSDRQIVEQFEYRAGWLQYCDGRDREEAEREALQRLLHQADGPGETSRIRTVVGRQTTVDPTTAAAE